MNNKFQRLKRDSNFIQGRNMIYETGPSEWNVYDKENAAIPSENIADMIQCEGEFCERDDVPGNPAIITWENEMEILLCEKCKAAIEIIDQTFQSSCEFCNEKAEGIWMHWKDGRIRQGQCKTHYTDIQNIFYELIKHMDEEEAAIKAYEYVKENP